MSDKFTIQLIGHRDVAQALRELRDELPKDPLRKAVRLAAVLLAQFIALAAPRLTGRLTRNIDVRVSHSGSVVYGNVIVNTAGKRGDPQNAFYWRFLEKGWRALSGVFYQFPFIVAVFEAKHRQAAQQVIDVCEAQVIKAQAKIDRASR